MGLRYGPRKRRRSGGVASRVWPGSGAAAWVVPGRQEKGTPGDLATAKGG